MLVCVQQTEQAILEERTFTTKNGIFFMSQSKKAGGYIKVYRQWLDLPILKHYPDNLAIFQRVMNDICWKEEGDSVLLYRAMVYVKMGQVAVSATRLAEQSKVSRPTVTRLFKRLEKMGVITCEAISHGFMVTINDPKNTTIQPEHSSGRKKQNVRVNVRVEKDDVPVENVPVESSASPQKETIISTGTKINVRVEKDDVPVENVPVNVPVLYNTALRTIEEHSDLQVKEDNTSLERNNNFTEDAARAEKPKPVREYAWEGRVIRLNQRDYDQWRKIYPNLGRDFDAVLYNTDLLLADEIADGKLKAERWFAAASRILLAKHSKTAPPAVSSNVDFDHDSVVYPPCGQRFDPPPGWSPPPLNTPAGERWAEYQGWSTKFKSLQEYARERKERENGGSQAALGQPVEL